MSRLEGNIALITGAASGIGQAIAVRFAAEGARLILVDVLADEVHALANSLGRHQAAATAGDVADEATLQRAVAQAQERFGRLDILVNNAYAATHQPLTELTLEGWRSTLDVCLNAIFFAARHAIPLMQRQRAGAIVNLGSVNGLVATPGMPAYTAAKGAVVALTRQLAVEYGPDGIRTNAVCPGLIATDEVRQHILTDPAEQQATIESCPLRRIGEPSDIAAAVLFLASAEAAFINGATLTVDGGTSVQWPPILLRPSLRRKARLSSPANAASQEVKE